MPDQPLAYFLSFTTYGAWLHGKDSGSVDVEHNAYAAPFLPPDAAAEAEELAAMTQPPFNLNERGRQVVLATIQEVCRYRGWRLIACHVRTTHVHTVVAGTAPPEKMMNDFKAYASRRLTEVVFDDKTRKRWTRHGSTKYVWDDDYLRNAIHYTLNRQGAPMARFAEDPQWVQDSE